MTKWLRWRLGTLALAAFATGGLSYLHAQNSYPPPSPTPEAAATAFSRFLRNPVRSRDGSDPVVIVNSASNSSSSSDEPAYSPALPFGGLVSRAQGETLSGSGRVSLEQLRRLLASELNETSYDAQVVGTQNSQTIVSVAPAPDKGREVVTVPEDGGYRVELKATFARWNNLAGQALDESWWRYTGITSPSLSSNGKFLRAQCQMNEKQIMLGVLQYAQDYDERLPPARRWQDVLVPYLKSEQLYTCPALRSGSNGYAYNQKLSQFPQGKINEAALTIHLYETNNPARNTFGLLTGKAYRHQDGMNLAFADGHIKWFTRDLVEKRVTDNVSLRLEP